MSGRRLSLATTPVAPAAFAQNAITQQCRAARIPRRFRDARNSSNASLASSGLMFAYGSASSSAAAS
eukprot:1563544-Alexandrium_andersonii.AAC.1